MKRIILPVAEVYRREQAATEVFGIPLLVLMENAGREAARVVNYWLRREKKKRVGIVCGRGNNGGDGLVAARYLINSGYQVKVALAGGENVLTELSFTNYKILSKMKSEVSFLDDATELREMRDFDAVVDALLGIGLRGPLKDREEKIIEEINRLEKPVFSLDVPSGLDADTGMVQTKAVQAYLTICFGFLKQGLFIGSGPKYTGRIKLVDIGFPWQLYQPGWSKEKNGVLGEN
ncbi:MAG: NAD(P)H-hydrate epimerase [Candidatus Omnitrophica bacterium]|nr:NAD(P)H-hydrate epimerase [Candidatus Omnitrophota bacterium]